MGRVVSVTKTITGDQARTTETEYDLSGKVKKITHPDGFEVTNTYYPGTNLLDNVKGTFDDVNIKEYAKCTEYEPTGKIGRITHPYNDTETVYTYNPQTTRLSDLLTVIYQNPIIFSAEIVVIRFRAVFWILPKSSGLLEKKRDKCAYSIFLPKCCHEKRRYCRNDDPANRLKELENHAVFHDANLGNIMTTIW